MLRNQTFPNNWKACSVQEIFKPLPNLSFSRDQLTHKEQTLEYIHYGDIHTGCIDELISEDSRLPYLVKEQVVKNIDKYLLCPGDIVLVDASEDYDGVTKSIEISNVGVKKIVAGLHTIPLRPLKGVFAPGFARYVFKHSIVSKTLKAIAQGTKVFSISFALIKKVILFCPPIAEQQKIVEVLETWDKAIQLTRKLIEQKELQKKYLMQQLLTGRTRLKGFVTPWRKTILGNLLKEKSLRNKDLAITRVLSVTNDRGFVLPQEQFSRQVASKNVSNYKVVLRGEFAYNPSRINVGSISFLATFEFGILSPMYVVFSCSEQILPQYFKYWIKTYEFISKVKNAAQGSVRATVDFQNLSTIKMNYPANIKEQLEISKVLSQADKEIDLLRQKLAKLEEQKKGLMQVLLTGKVRLQVGK